MRVVGFRLLGVKLLRANGLNVLACCYVFLMGLPGQAHIAIPTMNYVCYLSYRKDSCHQLQDQASNFLDHSQTMDREYQFSSIKVNQLHVVTIHHSFFHLHAKIRSFAS